MPCWKPRSERSGRPGRRSLYIYTSNILAYVQTLDLLSKCDTLLTEVLITFPQSRTRTQIDSSNLNCCSPPIHSVSVSCSNFPGVLLEKKEFALQPLVLAVLTTRRPGALFLCSLKVRGVYIELSTGTPSNTFYNLKSSAILLIEAPHSFPSDKIISLRFLGIS
jgi:hypothetical protein